MPLRDDRVDFLAGAQDEHFWFTGRRMVLNALLSKYGPAPDGYAADIGCGTGANLALLADAGYSATGVDSSWKALQFARKTPATALVAAEAARLPFRTGACAVVLLADLLEHTDDRLALGEACRVLRPGGIVVASVPAFPRLRSRRDEDAGHLRRYSRRELSRRMSEAGFQIVETRGYGFLTLPLVAATRSASRLSGLFTGPEPERLRNLEDRPPAIVNSTLRAVMRTEARLGRLVRWPIGSSLIAVGRKS